MAKQAENFLMYKGKPLVRKGNTLYYGNMQDEFVIMLSIMDSHEVNGIQISHKVVFHLLNTDPTVNPLEAVVKRSEKKGLWAAMDIGSVWLERALQHVEE